MIEKLLVEIGFTEEDIKEYKKYSELDGGKISALAKEYMTGAVSYADAVQKAHSDKMHEYTADLLLVVECAPYLEKKYEEKGIARERYIDAMRDIKCKLDECKIAKGVFGIFIVSWFEGYFALGRMVFGRLQYGVTIYDSEPVTIKGHTITPDEFCLACHIPSGGPLKPEMCVESFKMAYEFFKDKLKDGILVITCASWLLYRPYIGPVFPENSNTAIFAKYFEIVEESSYDQLYGGWRIFGVEYDGDPDKLPTDTGMRKRFVEYIKASKDNPTPFGGATGIILFDGEKVLTQR
ncbi:MAG: DUF5596 domain-containing protein [Clostridia bacterium]|nr:DUF5596 domain-containing protein [Clostridia bacterium]